MLRRRKRKTEPEPEPKITVHQNLETFVDDRRAARFFGVVLQSVRDETKEQRQKREAEANGRSNP